MKTVLIVEDDPAISDLIAEVLTTGGIQPIRAYSGSEALLVLQRRHPDLILLDLMLPGISGEAVMERVPDIPVIIVSARGEIDDKVDLLRSGAADYITKPFNPVEMTARVKAQLRRYMRYNSQKRDDNIIDFQGLILNCSTHECTLYGEKLNLTPTEFSILQMLCENRGKVISSQDLFESIWKEKYFESNNTVMVHIRRIREKMHEQPRNPKFIKTVWGMGYKIEK